MVPRPWTREKPEPGKVYMLVRPSSGQRGWLYSHEGWASLARRGWRRSTEPVSDDPKAKRKIPLGQVPPQIKN